MTRALLDVNVLVALLDAGHLHHRAATDWLSAHADAGWASCPLTQNGCVRIMSLAAYPNSRPPAAVAERLASALATQHHRFWPDSVSPLQPQRLHWDCVLTSRQVTAAYLLALATENGGRLLTFDRGISIGAVPGAAPVNLVTLS